MNTDLALHFGDPQAVPLLFWILSGAGVVLGAVVHLLFRFPRLRRPELRQGGAYPRLGAWAGVAVVLLFALLGWQASWGGFFTLATHGAGVTLHFRVPERSVTLRPGEVEGLEYDPALRGPGGTLVVRSRDGRVFRSTYVSREAVEGALEVLKPRLAPSLPGPSPAAPPTHGG